MFWRHPKSNNVKVNENQSNCTSDNITFLATLNPNLITFFVEVIKSTPSEDSTKHRASQNGLVSSRRLSKFSNCNLFQGAFNEILHCESGDSVCSKSWVWLSTLISRACGLLTIAIRTCFSFAEIVCDENENLSASGITTEYFVETNAVDDESTAGGSNALKINSAIFLGASKASSRVWMESWLHQGENT
jgi:hypothetical protein